MRLCYQIALGLSLTSSVYAANLPSLLSVQIHLQQQAQQAYLPALAAFTHRSEQLQQQLQTLCKTGASASALEPTREAWRAAWEAWQGLALLHFGPSREGKPNARDWLIDSHQVHGARPNAVAQAVERILNEDVALDATLLSAERPFARGLPALEYLLFSAATAPLADNRSCQYALAAGSDLQQQAQQLQQAWQGYVEHTWLSDGPQAALEQVSNQLVNAVDGLRKRVEVRRPEALAGAATLRGWQAQLESIQRSYSDQQYGLGLLLQETQHAELDGKIRQQLQASTTALLALGQDPLKLTDPELQAALLRELNRLYQLLRLEALPAMGVRPGFSASDGD